MLHYAVVFFVIALIAALFGFGGIAASAVGEHHRRPRAVRLVVELNAVDGREGHAPILRRREGKRNRERRDSRDIDGVTCSDSKRSGPKR